MSVRTKAEVNKGEQKLGQVRLWWVSLSVQCERALTSFPFTLGQKLGYLEQLARVRNPAPERVNILQLLNQPNKSPGWIEEKSLLSMEKQAAACTLVANLSVAKVQSLLPG